MEGTRGQTPKCHPCDPMSVNDNEDQIGHYTKTCPGPMSESLAYVNVPDSSRLEHAGGLMNRCSFANWTGSRDCDILGVSSRIQGRRLTLKSGGILGYI